MLIKDKDGNDLPFEYSPTWYYHPIIIGDKKYDLDLNWPEDWKKCEKALKKLK